MIFVLFYFQKQLLFIPASQIAMTKRSSSRIPSLATSRAETPDSSGDGSRQRQSKKDEAIRKKLEHELARKRSGTTRIPQTRKTGGTVSSLRPRQALTVKENLSVIEAAQLLAAKRSDCVLVVDDDDHLSGIFTAKDLAYRVVAESLDARTTPVSHIMTKGPMCVTADTSATDALNLMVSRGFRHLPVCNDEGDIFGLLDITKCLYEALDKMERAYGSSRKLYDALEGVEKEWFNSPIQLVQYMEALRDRMSCPDLGSVLDGTVPAEVSVKTNVRDVACIMKEHHTTAVLVMDRDGLAGIFTTKDIVLRVIAAGLQPENCSVVRVMTPRPDTATPQTTILDALQRMNDGHYLNLPVLDGGVVVGMVDVLKLTYVTLEQIHSMQGNDGEGPMWSRFWDSVGAMDTMENDSQSSDRLSSPHLSSHERHSANAISPEPSTFLSNLQGFPEITPNESASMVAKNEDALSNISSQPLSRHHHNSTREDATFAFKFTSASGKTHRFTSSNKDYQQLLEIVRQKMLPEHVDDGTSDWLMLSYMDDENDEVLITSDADVYDAVQLAVKLGQDRVKLIVQDTTRKDPVTASAHASTGPSPAPASPVATKLNVHREAYATNGPKTRKRHLKRRSRRLDSEMDSPADDDDDEFADDDDDDDRSQYAVLPQEILLPAAIAFLGVVILGVFAYSRVTPRHR